MTKTEKGLQTVKLTANATSKGVLGMLHVRNEMLRMEGVLDHHRRLGIGEFVVVDNGSTDGTLEFLEAQADVSLFVSDQPYSRGRYGLDATNALLDRFGDGRWCLTIDADEYFVYPHCESKSLSLLTRYLERQGAEAVFAVLLDMYSDRSIAETNPERGRPLWEVCPLFDSNSYQAKKAGTFPFMELFGGPRHRIFWKENSETLPPTTSKVPLVKWRRGYRYVSSTHYMRPGPNHLAGIWGALLHFKFLSDFHYRAEREAERGEHFDGAREYKIYLEKVKRSPDLSLIYEGSREYRKSTDLVHAGLVPNEPSWSFFL